MPSNRTRARDTVKVGHVVTTEVPGLAEVLRRPGIHMRVELRRTDGAVLTADVVIPDAVGLLTPKALVRSVRNERRDLEDFWRCLEIAAADGVAASAFDNTTLKRDRAVLWRELGPGGSALARLTADLQDAPAAQLRTRIRALLVEVLGADS